MTIPKTVLKEVDSSSSLNYGATDDNGEFILHLVSDLLLLLRSFYSTS